MKIKLFLYALVVVISNVKSTTPQNDLLARHRMNLDNSAQDSDGKYFDQIALDSFTRSTKEEFPDDFPNYPQTSYTASQEFRKSLKKPHKLNEKVQYVTAEPYRESFSQDYVHHALKTHSEKSNKEKISIGPTQSSAASMIDEYSIQTRDESKKSFPSKRKKVENAENSDDYRNVFHESKRLFAKTSPTKFSSFSVSSTTTTTTSTVAPFVDDFESFYRPHSSDAIIKKETVKNGGDEVVNNYHYYYPDKTLDDFHFPSSTLSPTVTSIVTKYPTTPTSTSWLKKKPKLKSFQKKKVAPVKFEYSSPDPYQFQPVIPRPSEYATFENFYPSLDLPSSTVDTVSTITSQKIFKPTKKSKNFYLPTSTFSPSSSAFVTTKRPRKAPSSTLVPFRNVKQSHSASPTYKPSTTAAHFSTTKAPDFFKYSTPSSTIAPTKSYESFLVHPSSSTSLPSFDKTFDKEFDESRDDVVVIKPKSQFINMEPSMEQKPEVKETVIYRFVPEYHTVNSSMMGQGNFDSFYPKFNDSSFNDEFLRKFHKNYNYEPFTEKDAGPLPYNDNVNFDINDNKQRAEDKAMIVQISQDDNEDSYPSPSPSPYPLDREYPPSYDDDHEAEASKNQYLFLYSLADEEEKKRSKHHQKMKKPKPQQDPNVFYHHHQHDYKDPKHDDSEYDPELDSEFDSDLMNTENVRIVDPNVRGGKPLEFTKDDYLRHIKQAVVQYMKENHKESFDTMKQPNKNQEAKSSKSATKALQNLSPHQFKQFTQQLKLPKNIYNAGQLQEAIEDMRESPQVDLTTKRSKTKPIDLAALDVGQTYQHGSQFDHAAALKNVEEFDQTNAVPKAKIQPLTQQNYKDINNLRRPQYDDEDEPPNSNLFKGYKLPSIRPYNQQNEQQQLKTYATMIDGKKLPRIRGNSNDDDDEDENRVDDPIDAPIQIINGIPVANPYNIDLSTLKYMLGGMAQAQVNDQIKDLDGSSTNNNNFKFPNNWKFPSNSFANFNSQTPVYPVFGSQGQSPQAHYDNRRQKKPPKSNNSNEHDFPLLSQLSSYNNNNNNNYNQNYQNNKKKSKNPRNPGISDYSAWNSNKKHRAESQFSASNQNKIFLRPMMKNKHSRDEKLLTPVRIPRVRHATPSTEMRPPPVVKIPKAHILLKKVV